MTAGQALLCGILYWLAEANVPYVTVWTLQKPLMCCWIAGCILGCPEAGALTGALLSLLYIGYRSQGSSMPADLALAGICAASVCSAGAAPGTAVLAAIPAGAAGILVWQLRLHVNVRFGRQTEAAIRDGRKWGILIPAVLRPVLFSAAVCIPVGALVSLGAFHCAGRLLTMSAVSGGALRFLEPAGLCACAAALPLSLFPLRDKKSPLLFLGGLASTLILGVPVFLPALLFCAFFVFLLPCLEKKYPRLQKKGPGSRAGSVYAESLDQNYDKYYDPDLDPDFAPDFNADPDLDSDFDPDFNANPDFDPDLSADPDFAPDPGFSAAPASNSDPAQVPAADQSDQSYRQLSAPALAASSLLWILFVQAAYNTHLMMGQAAAAAFLPVLSGLYPGDPAGQQAVLLRQCVYLNTQPEMGSSLIGCMIHMEAEHSSGSEDAQYSARIRSVRSALMGFFGGAGDELFQCGWIPVLLMIFCDLVLRSRERAVWILLYGAAAALSAAVLSAVSFVTGLTGDEMRLLSLLEGDYLPRLHRLRNRLVPFVKGAVLGVWLQLILIPFLTSL